MLRVFIAFFAGVALTFYVLIPGKIQPRDLLNSQKRSQLANFDQASEKVDRMGDLAAFYASKAKNYVQKNIVQAD